MSQAGGSCEPAQGTRTPSSRASQLTPSSTVIQKLCKRLSLRQQVIASAIVFFRRYYLRNSYCETDPPLVAAACCYVAAKAEETPVHVKSAVSEAKAVFNGALWSQSEGRRRADGGIIHRDGIDDLPKRQHEARRDGVLPYRGARFPPHRLPPVPIARAALWTRRESERGRRGRTEAQGRDARDGRHGAADGMVRTFRASFHTR